MSAHMGVTNCQKTVRFFWPTVYNMYKGGKPNAKMYVAFTGNVALRLSQLSLLCDWPVKHPAVEYI